MGTSYGQIRPDTGIFFVFWYLFKGSVFHHSSSTPRGVLLEDELGGEVSDWFGSIGRSMQTLFTIQTLAGWVSWSNGGTRKTYQKYKGFVAGLFLRENKMKISLNHKAGDFLGWGVR